MRKRLKPGTIGRARPLRARATDLERKVWYRLRGLKAVGFHFRRQAPFRSYILDFVEHSRRVVIELDGGQHGDAAHKVRDQIRDRMLTAEGYCVLRFWNVDVLENIDGTVEYIVSMLNNRPPTRTASPSDLPTRGRWNPRLAPAIADVGRTDSRAGALRRIAFL